jgi:hypothetical protein
MLRRYILAARVTPRSASVLATSALLSARYVASGNPDSKNDKNKDAAKKEDEAELERERKLREAFGQKIGGDGTSSSSGATSPFGGGAGPIPNIPMPTNWAEFKVAMKQVKEQARAEAERRTGRAPGSSDANASAEGGSTDASSSSSSAGSSGFGKQTPTGPQPGPMFFFLQNMYTFLVYGTALYALIILWQMRDDGSLLNLMQGLPHWAGNPSDAAAFLLMRVLSSYSEQSALQTDFETFRKMAPDTTFRQFAEARNASWFAGNRYRHHEVLAVVAGALVHGDFGTVTRTMGKAARASRDRREQCDAIADAVRQLGFQPLYATQQVGSATAAPQLSMQQALAQQYQQSLAAYQQQQQMQQWYQYAQQQQQMQQQQARQPPATVPAPTSSTGSAELDQVVSALTTAVRDGDQKSTA